jgi:CBS-domain-containing membrane protein
MPAVDHEAPDLTGLTVSQVMSGSVITCRPETPAREVARMMATHAVHAIPIESETSRRIVTARELAQVACSAAEHTTLTAEDVCVDAVTAGPEDALPTAAARMLDRKVSHLVVVDPVSREAVGIVSDADIVSRWSWRE